MAGIGFALRDLARADDLLGVARAYLHATVIASGPWLATILALGTLSIVAGGEAASEDVALFRLCVIYNFGFSLIFAGPIAIVATRYLADGIYARDVTGGPGLLLGACALVALTQGPPVAIFYFVFVEAPWPVRLAATSGYLVTAYLWVAAVFLTALKDYAGIAMSFAVGMATGFLAGWALAPLGPAGLLFGFSAGLATVLFAIVARIFAEYPYPIVRPFAFLIYFRRYWELALTALAYNAAIWVDKWVMWAAPRAETMAGALISYPDYDSAMFLAYLTILPAMALFVLLVETSFYERYLAFFREIRTHGTWMRLQAAHREIVDGVGEGFRLLAVVQGAVSYLTILVAPAIFDALGIGFTQIGMFRFGVLGAMFHALLLFVLIVFAYFDLRLLALKIALFFLASNLVLSWGTLHAGFEWYGYGYFLSAALSFAVGYWIMLRKLGNLPYLAFVEINPSVRRD
jgi:polysaccharide biosynthesis protein PelG